MKTWLSLIVMMVSMPAIWGTVDMAKFEALHPEGAAIQIANGIDLAYYTKNHDLCFGVGGFTHTTTETGSTKENVMKPGVFIRQNYPLTDNVTWGLGVSIGTIIGDNYDDSIRFKQYVSIEYAATDRIYLMASIRSIDYESYKQNGTETKVTKLLGGSSVQIAYRF